MKATTTPSDKQTNNQPALQPPELLPCPFCGAAPNLKQVPSRTVSANYWWIGCEIKGDNLTHSLSGCGIGHSAWSETEVVAKWNTRARVDGGAKGVDEVIESAISHASGLCNRGRFEDAFSVMVNALRWFGSQDGATTAPIAAPQDEAQTSKEED